MRWTASNQYQEDKRMGRVVGQGEHDSQLLRMLEDTNENKFVMILILIDGMKFKVCGQSPG
jgi:hypothetical protein